MKNIPKNKRKIGNLQTLEFVFPYTERGKGSDVAVDEQSLGLTGTAGRSLYVVGDTTTTVEGAAVPEKPLLCK